MMNILWAFNLELPKDPQTGLPIPLDEDDMTDVCSHEIFVTGN